MSGNHVVNVLITYANNYVIGNNKKFINKDITLSHFLRISPLIFQKVMQGKGYIMPNKILRKKKYSKSIEKVDLFYFTTQTNICHLKQKFVTSFSHIFIYCLSYRLYLCLQ